jgi:hypothetical protein
MSTELWYITGASIVLVGLLIAILLDPTTKRRYDDDDLPPGAM